MPYLDISERRELVSDLGDKFENALTSTLAYSTTTNNASTILRLKDGETQILAGLIRAYTNNSTKQKVPLLGDIPLLGRLFGINADDWQNREIVLAITPHIIRNKQALEADLLELWSGTQANIKLATPTSRWRARQAYSAKTSPPPRAPRRRPQPARRAAYRSKDSARGRCRGGARRRAGGRLTIRKREVLKLEGNSNKNIAVYLCLSIKTVEKHRASLMHKLVRVSPRGQIRTTGYSFSPASALSLDHRGAGGDMP